MHEQWNIRGPNDLAHAGTSAFSTLVFQFSTSIRWQLPTGTLQFATAELQHLPFHFSNCDQFIKSRCRLFVCRQQLYDLDVRKHGTLELEHYGHNLIEHCG